MNYFFSADTHFGHANIIRYCQRPFQNIKEMDRIIIRKFNERIKENDILFMIGDFCFKKSSEAPDSKKKAYNYYKEQLKCKNIIFIKGNHDKNNSTKTIIERLVIGYGDKRINLVHNPEFADVNYEINFTGHVHNKWEIKRVKRGWQFTDCINVGVDVFNFYPVRFEEIMKRYIQWKKRGLK